ncbi:biotin-dependent carboxyltransferase family protein [Bacillus thermotolerans]|uniref:5-oxoprolinase subunit C family protein n=1 Tax=Bacillus thermotolerans TaxID=1221996 RepID=UPI000589549C|nr:biotin-dependent carboxyltransferase family protein [Bacillus thermotolerans]KKB44483.1 Allophanate hydrolase 2 subunit 2 [Bacillus thermotolerans]
MLYIHQPGLRTTIQDTGRFGHYHMGVPPSGAADKYSFLLGNALLGNPSHYAGLEIMLQGPVIEFQKATVIALTGAPAKALLNGEDLPFYEPVAVSLGDVLEIGEIKNGIFAYLTISGGLNTPEILGSRSMCVASGFPGVLGRALLEGDCIPVKEPLPGALRQISNSILEEVKPVFRKELDLHIVLGISSESISDEGLIGMLNEEWTVHTQSNRVAYRLRGGKVRYKTEAAPFGSGSNPGNIVDIPYPIGGVIVPNEEELIVLLNDGTGGGGFVTTGAMVSSDISLLAQARPQTTVRFHAVTVEKAFQLRREKEQLIEKVKAAMQQA